MTLLDLSAIQHSLAPPPLFERGEPMWHDPYIATQMLKFHLNASHDIASRRPQVIDQIVSWMIDRLNLQAGMHLLDLGCGPGLYTKRFSEKGLITTGIDYSQNSIDYAKAHDPATIYLCQNYVDMDFPDESFDMIMMIYGDFCVLNNEERDRLLAKVYQYLKQDGYFVFDVTQPQMHQYLANHNRWSIAPQGGFWKPAPYLVLEQGFSYAEDIILHQYIVIEEDGTQTIYRNWFHDYTPETLQPLLARAGYNKVDYFSDLIGTPYADDSDWCGVILQK